MAVPLEAQVTKGGVTVLKMYALRRAVKFNTSENLA